MSVSSNVAEEEDPMFRRFLREDEEDDEAMFRRFLREDELIDRWESAQTKGKIPVHQEPEIYPDDEGPGTLELIEIEDQRSNSSDDDEKYDDMPPLMQVVDW